jgi:hypothetical protein
MTLLFLRPPKGAECFPLFLSLSLSCFFNKPHSCKELHVRPTASQATGRTKPRACPRCTGGAAEAAPQPRLEPPQRCSAAVLCCCCICCERLEGFWRVGGGTVFLKTTPLRQTPSSGKWFYGRAHLFCYQPLNAFCNFLFVWFSVVCISISPKSR